jgi:hypothetical protein
MFAATIMNNHGGGVHAAPCSQQTSNITLNISKESRNEETESETSAAGSYHDTSRHIERYQVNHSTHETQVR